MLVDATIEKPYYDIKGRKYLDLKIRNTIFQVKVPFRYGRVMCKVNGIVPVQDMEVGQEVNAVIDKRQWDDEVFWVLVSIRLKLS